MEQETTYDSMTSSHYCFGLKMKSHEIHEGKSKSLSRNPVGSSTSISIPIAWPKRVGSRKKSNACTKFDAKTECEIKKQSLTDITNDDACRKETDTQKQRFLRFFRMGFTNKSKKQKAESLNNAISPFDAIKNVSAKHSHFAKYLALESSVNQSLTYLPSTVKMSLQWPEQEKSDTSDPGETHDSTMYKNECVNPEEINYKNDIYTDVMIQPPKCGQRSSSVTPSDRFSEISTDRSKEFCSVSEKVYPPTPVAQKSDVLLRRPRTPTLGRAALFVRASYMGVDKSGTPSSLSFSKQNTKRDTVLSNDSHLSDFPNLSRVQSGFISRSSSINSELREFNQNPQQSFNRLFVKNDSSQTNLKVFTSNERQHETKIPKSTPNRHNCHAYDTVPLDKLECLKLIPSVQMLGKSSETNPQSSDSALIKPTGYVSTTMSSLYGGQKLPSYPTEYNIERTETQAIKPNIFSDMKHSVDLSITSSSETELSSLNYKQPIKNESNGTLETSSLQFNSQTSLKNCGIITNLPKSVEIPKASVQPVRQKSGKTIIGAELPTSPKSRSSQKSSNSFYFKSNKNLTRKSRQSIISNLETSTELLLPKHNSTYTEQFQNGKLIMHSINIGSFVLRRRAKPELENEQHKDVSLRISIQEVKNLSAKGRYFCEICLDRTLYARTTSKLSDGTVFWGEQFDLNNLPSISIMTINLFRQATSVKDKRQKNKNQNQFISYVTIPLNDDSKQCEIQKWFTMQPPPPVQMNPNINYIEGLHVHHQQHQQKQQTDTNQTSPKNSSDGGSGRFRKHSTPASCFGYSNSFSIIPSSQYTTTTNNNNNNSNNKLNDDNELKHNYIEQSKKKSSWTAGVNTDGNFHKTNKINPKLSSPTSTTTSPNLSPNSNSVTNNFILPENSLPQLRMKIHYQTIDILPIVCYDELKEFIKTKYLDLIKSLEIKLSAKQKEELASCFVNIFEKLPDLSVAEFLSSLLREDLSNNGNESMIFRANSTGSKAMECYIKLVGTDYLQFILGPIIDQLLVVGDEFEIDPSRLGASGDSSNNRNQSSAILERNRTALLKYVTMIWQRIESSQCKLPKELRDVFIALASTIEESHGVQSSAHLISSCLFLRFICPAIHGPVLFGLASSVPENNRISRNLTLIAKVLQNLANLTLFEDKEHHMKVLNPFVEQEIPTMYQFLRSISSNTDANYHTAINFDCHEFIELGYEFAKLTQLLNNHVSKINITPQIAELPGLLQNITESLNSQTFKSWNNKSQTNFDRTANSSSNFFRSGIPRHHSFANTNSISSIDNRRQSETTNSTKPPLTNLREVDRKLSLLPSNNTVKTLCNQQETSNNIASINSADSNECIPNTNQEQLWDTFVIQKEYLPCKFNSADMIFQQIHINNLEQPENMEELLSQYREQLRQLNDCIDKVGPNCYYSSNPSHILNHSTQSVDKIRNSPNKISNNHNNNNNHIKNKRFDRNLSRQIIDEKLYRKTKQKVFNSKSANSAPIPVNYMLNKAQCAHRNSDNELNNHSLNKNNNHNDDDEVDDNYTIECDISRTLVPIRSTSITVDLSSTSDSDYDYDDDDEDDDRITECTTEDTSEYTKKIATKNNRPRKISIGQNHLSESPSLDQLAEKLQELKKMLQLERQEIEEVVASKTEVIKQQEKSIEQLESELDQLRKEHRPLKVKPPNGRHTSKSTSRTVSPTSSFSSEYYSSNLSDITQACQSYNNPFNHNDMHNNNNNNNNSNTSNNNHFWDSSVSNYHNNQGLNNLNRGELINAENYRTQSFREKLLWRGQVGRCEPQVICDSNLLYLSKASEGTGIPLGHLIEANRSVHIGRRVSETKLSPH
ncbi:unnamed protein product [Schistosoma turkestanicum]|nr:unnamed protein product [Schistosoma turkestanicum]